jgi:glycine/D-amino acid oxidase-like deaminating enzyme/nitrite reductase/ring-hydroxylating ferredoxin subunit
MNVIGKNHMSLWMATTPATDYPPLMEDIDVDVAVIGGGLAGLSSALVLAESGAKVAVLESARIGTGVSGHTTAKITSQHRRIFHHLIRYFGHEKAQLYALANQQAITSIEGVCRKHSIDCDFEYKPAFVFAQTDEHLKLIEEEIQAGQTAGLEMSFVKDIGLPLKIKGAAMLPGQAQFHPRKYMLGIAEALTSSGGSIYENSRVVRIECENKGPCMLLSKEGKTVRAKDIIVTTNSPIHDRDGLYFTRLRNSNSYAVGLRNKDKFPEGMFINSEDEGHSFRQHPVEGGEIVIVLNGSHTVGQGGDIIARYRELTDFARTVFDVESVEYWWTAQDAISLDMVPYIGRYTEGHRHLFLATGFRKWGMTQSIVAAQLIADMISGRQNSWEELYTPHRLKPLATGGSFVSQGIKIVESYVEKVLPASKIDVESIKNGEADVGESGGKKAAVFRDEKGRLFEMERSCMHLGCPVNWNNAEKSWDCPCHGSRYNFDGKVIHSPTVKDLQPLTEVRKQEETRGLE